MFLFRLRKGGIFIDDPTKAVVELRSFIQDAAVNLFGLEVSWTHSITWTVSNANNKKNPDAGSPLPAWRLGSGSYSE